MEITNKNDYGQLEIARMLNRFLESHGIKDKALLFNCDLELEEMQNVKYQIKQLYDKEMSLVGYLLKMTYVDSQEITNKFYNDIESLVIDFLDLIPTFVDFQENYDFCIFRYDYLKGKTFSSLSELLHEYVLMEKIFNKSF